MSACKCSSGKSRRILRYMSSFLSDDNERIEKQSSNKSCKGSVINGYVRRRRNSLNNEHISNTVFDDDKPGVNEPSSIRA